MPTLTIRNLPADVYARLRERARRNRRSVTQEAAMIIEEALRQAEAASNPWAQVDRIRESVRSRYGSFPDSATLIREDRER
ncbi:MAG: Arc family DNA-binding protein, partial [Armatimonadota bacterium]|nr:Arc family DNA-binding protein [Armatimonadota bacterium]